MLFITYSQTSGGRSGHALSDIITVFVFSVLTGAKPVYNKTWTNQRILTENALRKYSIDDCGPCNEILMSIEKWEGLSFNEYRCLLNLANESIKTKGNTLIKLSNVTKIYPHITIIWNKQKLIDEVYYSTLLPLLRNLYYYDHDSTELDVISVHIRCGDLKDRMWAFGFTYDYYESLFKKLSVLRANIHIYCENFKFEFLKPLENIDNVTMFVGGKEDFEKHFNNLCRSKILILSASSMSLFAGYFCRGLVLIDNQSAKFRPNLFTNTEHIFHHFNDISDKLDIIKLAM